jgi:hypothetical protein
LIIWDNLHKCLEVLNQKAILCEEQKVVPRNTPGVIPGFKFFLEDAIILLGGAMKAGDSVQLRNSYAGNPDKENRMRNITEKVAERNAIRILVNSTGAFPMNPEEKKQRKQLFSKR